MPAPGVPSLDQLTVFLAVVESGSFAAARRRLGRATSAVSYSIANLEQQLGEFIWTSAFGSDRVDNKAQLAVQKAALSGN
jgi:regulatory helix-turn-helix LysR family protein